MGNFPDEPLDLGDARFGHNFPLAAAARTTCQGDHLGSTFIRA